jgi:amino acid transporter
MKRVLGMPALVFFGLAYMVPLTVWTTYGVVTTSTNGHLPAAYVVTTLAMLLTAYSYGRMAVVYPRAGSAYTYTRKTLGRGPGFLIGWVLLLDYIFLPMICYLVIGLYMHDYFPVIPQWAWIIGSIVLTTGMNIVGIKLVSSVNFAFIGVQFVFIAVFVVMALKTISDGSTPNFISPFYSSDLNLGLVFSGAAVLALSFLGFDAVSTLSEETTNPTVRIPRAILWCTVAGGGLYLIESYIGALAFPDFHAFSSVDVATVDVMKRVGGAFLNTFFTAAYVAGCFACALASQASVSRILFAMGRDGVLPNRVFGQLHPRLRTPVFANLIVGVLGLAALFVSLETASTMISFGALGAFTFVNLSVLAHYVIKNRRRAAGDLLRYALIPVLGVAFNAYLWTSLSGTAFKIGLSWLTVGVIYLALLTRGFRKPVPELDMAEHHDADTPTAVSDTACPTVAGAAAQH